MRLYEKIGGKMFGRFFVFLICSSAFVGLAADAGLSFSFAKINPAYVKWLNKQEDRQNSMRANALSAVDGASRGLISDDEMKTGGLIPTKIDFSYLTNCTKRLVLRGNNDIPARYDKRGQHSTPVRHQDPNNQGLGTCWAQATVGAMETYLKKQGLSVQYSVRNIVNNSGMYVPQSVDDWEKSAWKGGNYSMSSAYLLRWNGPISESADPYVNAQTGIVRLGYDSPTLPPEAHLQRTCLIPARTSSTDNDRLKRAIMEFGGVCVSMSLQGYSEDTVKWGHYTWNPDSYGAYYLPNGDLMADHAVTVVGWDDTYSKENFNKDLANTGFSGPVGNGAFIVKDSYGNDKCRDNGYIYVSYYDAVFARKAPAWAFPIEPTVDNYSRIYQYDTYGWSDSIALLDSTGKTLSRGYAAAMYEAEEDAYLAAIGFYATQPATQYKIAIYSGCTAGEPSSGDCLLEQEGVTDEYAGFQTIKLDETIALTQGKRFSVVLYLSTPNANPFAVEYYDAMLSPKAAASRGETFFSFDGKDWTDAVEIENTLSFCCKAYTTDKAAPPVIPAAPTVSISGTTLSWNTVPGAKYYKVYRSTNPFADPVAVSGWLTARTYMVEKPSAEGTCYFYFVKAASEQDDATAGPFNEVRMDAVNHQSGHYSDCCCVPYDSSAALHFYGREPISDTPYEAESTRLFLTSVKFTETFGSGSGIAATVIEEFVEGHIYDVSTNPTIPHSYSSSSTWTLKVTANANTSTVPRSYAFTSNAQSGYDPTMLKPMIWIHYPHYIYQAGIDALSVDGPTSLEVGKGCSTNRVTITATPSTTAWTATTDSPDWITLYRTSSTGSGVLGYIVAENPNDEAREGHITLIGASTKKVLTVKQTGTKLLPDLYPYKPSGWSAPVVATTSSSSTTTPSSFSTSDTIYVRWAVGCRDQDVNAPFKTCLYVDGALSKTYSTSELSAGKYTYNSPAYSLGKLSAGKHEIKIVADKENTIKESNENNNEYLISIDVQQPVTLTSLTIDGESSVYSGSKTTYTCKAYYSDGASEMVSPSWSIYSGSSYASIDSETGVLTAKTVSSQQSVTIRATYGGVSKNKVITIKPSIAMSTAVDNTTLSFVTGGAAPWFGQTTTTHDGVDALQSGDVEDDEESWVQTSVTGAGEISFWWYVESEQSYDLLEFLIDGEVKGSISGTNNSWGQKRFVISGSGSHTLQWRYSKDLSASRGLDAGFIDQVVWTPSAPVAQDKPDIGFMSFASLTYKKGYVYMSDVWSNDAIRVCTKGVQYLANYGFGNWGAGDAVGTITNQIEVYDDRAKLISANAVSKSINLPSRRGYSNNSRAYSEWKNLPSGAYMLMVRLDVGGCFDEEDETNNSDAYWFAVRDPTSLDEALDNETLVFDTDAKNGWFGTKGIGADGVDAAQSTHLGHSSTNKMSTTVSGPGTFAFKWKVSSEKNQDRLQFLIDGSVKCEISGIDGGWESRSFDIPDGVHAVEWQYVKDKQYSVGGDCGWVDQVVWESSPSIGIPIVSASYGTWSDGVHISWKDVQGAKSYDIYRATSLPCPSMPTFTGVTSPFNDETAIPGVKYYYWVAAVNASERSVSSFEIGYRAVFLGSIGVESLFSAEGGTRDVPVWANTTWSASADVDWIKFGVGSGEGNGVCSYTVVANPTAFTREGTITVTAGGGTAHPVKSVLPVSQAGVGGEFEIKDGVLTKYYGSSNHVVIPSEVRHIGDHVFSGHDEIVSLTIPSNVESIGDYAFDDCSELMQLEIAEGVVNIGDYAFAYCDALTSVVLPRTVASIGDSAFVRCSQMRTLILNEGLSAIGERAFEGCSEIISVSIPSTVDSIGKLAFASCSSMTTLTIREGVTSLGAGMVFGYCTGLISVVLPASIVDAGWATFSYCSGLEKLTFKGLPPDDLLNSVLLNSSSPLIRYNKAYEKEWLIAFSNCGYGRYEAFLPDVMPIVEGDEYATVTGDAATGFVVKPSEGKTAVEVTIPQGVDAAKVTVEVSPKVSSVKPNGAKVKIVSGGSDITEFLNVPAADGDGVVDLTKATVKAEIVKEALDPEKGAKIELNAANPLLTTPNTRVGLFYQLREGETLGGMKDGDSTVGDGQPWTPEIKVKGGNSAFYSIGVGKGE